MLYVYIVLSRNLAVYLVIFFIFHQFEIDKNVVFHDIGAHFVPMRPQERQTIAQGNAIIRRSIELKSLKTERHVSISK